MKIKKKILKKMLIASSLTLAIGCNVPPSGGVSRPAKSAEFKRARIEKTNSVLKNINLELPAQKFIEVDNANQCITCGRG